MKFVRHQLAEESGAEIAEAAVVLPIAFMFLLGIVWFGRAFNIYSTITQAAQQGAVAAARATCATCTNTLMSPTQVDNVISAVLQASHLDPNQIPMSSTPDPQYCTAPDQLPAGFPDGNCTTTAHNIKVCRSVILNPSQSPAQCGALVTFQYPFQFYLPFTSLNNQRIILTAQSQSRMEN